MDCSLTLPLIGFFITIWDGRSWAFHGFRFTMVVGYTNTSPIFRLISGLRRHQMCANFADFISLTGVVTSNQRHSRDLYVLYSRGIFLVVIWSVMPRQ